MTVEVVEMFILNRTKPNTGLYVQNCWNNNDFRIFRGRRMGLMNNRIIMPD